MKKNVEFKAEVMEERLEMISIHWKKHNPNDESDDLNPTLVMDF